MIAEWFVLSNGESIGPYTQNQIVEFIQEGSLSPTSYVRRLDGPWITIAEAFLRMVAAASSHSVSGTGTLAIPAPEPEPIAAYASTTSTPTFRYRRKKSSHLNLLMTIAAIAVGGAAAIYTAKGLLTALAPKAVEESEPEVIVVQRPSPAPKRPTALDVPSGPRKTRTPIEEVPSAPVVATKPTTPPEKRPPLPVPVSPAEDAKPDQATITWLSTLESIHTRRDSLMLKIAAVKQKGLPLEDQAKTIDAECRPKEKRIRELNIEIGNLDSDRRLLESAFQTNGDTSLPSKISRLSSTIQSLRSEIQSLDTTAQREVYRKLMSEINSLKEAYEQVLREADNLRAELVFHLNPFAAAPEPIAKAGLSYFSRPIPNNNALPNSNVVLKAWNEFGMACIYLRKGDDRNAEKFLNAAMTSEPQEATFRAIFGYWKLQRGQDDDALTEIVAALKAHPENWTVSFVMALIQLRKGALSSAEIFLRKCRELDKNNQRGLTLLSLLKSASSDEKIRNAKFAKQFADEALKLGKSAATHIATAAAHAEAGEFPDALKHAQSAVALREAKNPDDFYLRSIDALSKSNAIRIDWPKFDAWNQL
ncbi:MAG: GYF domain-containing protein [Planctomycetia bacterium]|nr:GYF domain-containing protein [Planctomycetia bacterium]